MTTFKEMAMASLIDELIHVLEEETGCYTLLLEMADNKKDVIIKGNMPGLQEMTQKEQELSGHLLRLEKKRKVLVEDICLVTNKSAEDMTLDKLIELLATQPAEQTRLQRAAKDIAGVVKPLKEANERNQQLLKQSMELVEFTMNALRSAKRPMNNSTYNAGGKGYSDTGSKGYFDAKQ